MITHPHPWIALGLLLTLLGCGGAQRPADESLQKAQPVAAPVGLQAAVLVERRGAGELRIDVLRDGEELANGDGVRLALQLEQPAHVLAVYLDSRSQATVLFPGEGIPLGNPLPAGRSLDIPLAGSWFTLEGEPGPEGIYLLASPAPLPDVPGLVARLAALGPGWTPARADQIFTEHLTRGAVRRTADGGRVAVVDDEEGEERLARPTPGASGDPDGPPPANAPPANPDRPRPFRRPMLLAGVVRAGDAGGELRRVLAHDGVEVFAVGFMHR